MNLRKAPVLGLLPALIGAGCLLAACSGSSSPTEPAPTSMAGSAKVTGEVSSGGAAGQVVAAATLAAPRSAALPGSRPGRSTDSLVAADKSGSGMTIRVQGTSISTKTDASGHFSLDGVPSGNQVLLFEEGGSTAPLPLPGVQANEKIDIKVTVQGSTANLDDITRSSDGRADNGETIDVTQLSLELAPDDWSLDFPKSSGTVDALLRGPGIDMIDLGSLELSGDNPDATPLAATSATIQGDHIHARFPKNQVLDLLMDPQPGSMHDVTLSFVASGSDERLEVTAQVTIDDDEQGDDNGDDGEGDDNGGDMSTAPSNLSLQLSPDTWNLNYDKSSGTVTAFIRGDGLDRIDLSSITLAGDNPDAEPLAASQASLEGNHVRARFPKNEVLGLLDNPTKGSTHTVTIAFADSETGDTFELTAQVKITGSDKGNDDEGDDEGDDGGNDGSGHD